MHIDQYDTNELIKIAQIMYITVNNNIVVGPEHHL